MLRYFAIASYVIVYRIVTTTFWEKPSFYYYTIQKLTLAKAYFG